MDPPGDRRGQSAPLAETPGRRAGTGQNPRGAAYSRSVQLPQWDRYDHRTSAEDCRLIIPPGQPGRVIHPYGRAGSVRARNLTSRRPGQAARPGRESPMTAYGHSPTVAPAGLRPSRRLKGPPAYLDCQSTTGAGVSRISGPIIRPDISGDSTRQGPQDHCGGSLLSNHIGSDGRRPLRTTGPVIGSTDVRAFTGKCPPRF